MSGGRQARIMGTSGSSMEPLLRSGSMVGVVRARAGDLRPGDVIAFRDGETTVVHRVVELDGGPRGTAIREKGDNRPFSSWIGEDRLAGRVAWARSGDSFRRLHPAPRPRLLGWLTRLFRLEADLFDAVKGWTGARGEATGRARRAACRLAGPFLLAARLPVRALLLLAYPVDARRDGTAERGYLIECVRAAAGETPAPPAPPGTDWPFLLAEAERHGLGPLVSLAAGESVPPEFAVEAARARARSALAQISGRATLADVAAALGEAGISYAVLKGPVLASTLYPQEWLRPYSDVDVAVRRRDRKTAAAALAGRGYRLESGRLAARFLEAGHFHLALVPGAEGKLTIELHWGFVDRVNLNRVEEDEALDRARLTTAAGMEVMTLEPEDELIYLCLHVAKHGVFNRVGLAAGEPPGWFCKPFTGNRLIWFLDIARHLDARGRAADWEKVRERAVAWNVTEEMAVALGVLEHLVPGAGAGRAMEALGLEPVSRGGWLALPLRRRRVQSLVESASKMRPGVLFRPVRLLAVLPVLFPPPRRLLACYGSRYGKILPLLYAVHPFLLAARVVRGRRG